MTGVAGTCVDVAQAADAVRVRGTVVSFEPSLLTVKDPRRRYGRPKLAAGWKISGVAKASADQIKPGDFVGIASVAKADGGSEAL